MPENLKSGERIAPEEKPVRARDLGLIVEEAILNALTAARDMRGSAGETVISCRRSHMTGCGRS